MIYISFNFIYRWVLSKAKKDDTDVEISIYDGTVLFKYSAHNKDDPEFMRTLLKLYFC